jgi:hypothetical protein
MPKRLVLLSSLLILALGALAQGTVLPVPTDLRAELAPTMGPMPAVMLTWRAPEGPWGFSVYRSEADTTRFIRLAFTKNRSFIDPRVANGVLYFYRVRTATIGPDSQLVESPPSNTVRFVLPVPPPPRPKGEIVGEVKDDASGRPIPGIALRFFYQGPSIAIYPPPSAFTDSLGRYRAVLDTGSYLVRAEPPPYPTFAPTWIPEWFDNVQDIRLATPVVVAPGSSFRANFALARPVPPKQVTIEGTVTNDVGMLTVVSTPLRGAMVVIMRPVPQATNTDPMALDASATVDGLGFCPGIVWRGMTDSLGHYKALLPAGAYIAVASKPGFLPEYYKEKINPLQADVIKADGNVSGIDFTLALIPVPQNSVSGMVRDSTGNGIPSRIVLFPLVRNTSWTMIKPAIRFGHTDSTGSYKIDRVAGGKYFVLAIPFRAYGPAFYKAGEYGVWNWQKADTVLASGEVTGIDIGVVKMYRCGVAALSGRVLSVNGAPVPGVRVLVLSAAGDLLGFGVTDDLGTYQVDGLPQAPMVVMYDREGYLAGQQTVSPGPSDVTLSAGDFRLDEILTSIHVAPFVPSEYQLHQNYPNPFNPSTTITYDMPAAGVARIAIYNILGQEVATILSATVEPGRRTVVWNGVDKDGRGVGSGIYFARFTANGTSGNQLFSQTRKMMLVR